MLGAIGGSHAAGSSQSHLESAQRFSSHWAWNTNVYNPPFVSQRHPEAGREPCNLCLLNKLLAFYSIFSTSRTGMLSRERAGSPFSGVQSWGLGWGCQRQSRLRGGGSADPWAQGLRPLVSAWPAPSRGLRCLTLEGTEHVSTHPWTLLCSHLGSVSSAQCRMEQLARNSKEVNK